MVARLAKVLVVGIAFASIASAPARAQPMLDGEVAFRAKAFGQAYLSLLPLGQQGVPRAQFLLGRMSDNGLGPIQIDPREAAKWYRRAAELGLPEAQFALANALATGRGVRQDAKASLEWLKRAAEGGHVSAALSLAALYDEGRGVDANPELATFWVQRPAEAGSPRAQYALGERLLIGQGIAANEDLAWMWLRRAAEHGYPAALYRMGRVGAAVKEGEGDIASQYMWLTLAAERGAGDVKANATRERALLAQAMTPEMVKQGQDRAKAWKPKASTMPPGLDDDTI
jgi:TPR repeat protein